MGQIKGLIFQPYLKKSVFEIVHFGTFYGNYGFAHMASLLKHAQLDNIVGL